MKKVKYFIFTAMVFMLPFAPNAATCGCVDGGTGYEWQVSGYDCSTGFLGDGATRINYLQDEKGNQYKTYQGVSIKTALAFCL